MYEIVNKQVKLFTNLLYRHLQKCLYKGDAQNRILTTLARNS